MSWDMDILNKNCSEMPVYFMQCSSLKSCHHVVNAYYLIHLN